MKIVAIVDSAEARAFDDVDRFAAAVAAAAGIDVPVVEGIDPDVPPEAYRIVFDSRRLDERHADRTILINADRASVSEHLERYGLAAAVEQHRFFLWRTQTSDEIGDGVYGRKDVAPAIGAASDLFESERYGLLQSSRFGDLPSLLAGYLAEYDRRHGGRS